MGDAVSSVALVVLVAQMTDSASAVGGVLVARLLPTLASPIVGVLADRLNRKAILVLSDLARAILVLWIVFAHDLTTLYFLAFLTGVARTFFNPTIRAAFPSIVGSGDMTRANSFIGGTFSASITVGPALGGLLVATVGVNAAFMVDAATYLVSAMFLLRISLPTPERSESAGFVRELRSGLSYLAGARVPLAIVVGAFLTTVTANCTIPAGVFLAKETFDAGAGGYGLLVSVWGGGMVVGSTLMAVLGDRAGLVSLFLASIFATAIALMGAGLAPAFGLALAALAIAGIANGVDNVATDTSLQRQVPEALLGRVFSVRFLGFSAGEAVAYPMGGLVVDAIGPGSTYVLAGFATAVAGLLVLCIILAVSAKNPDIERHL